MRLFNSIPTLTFLCAVTVLIIMTATMLVIWIPYHFESYARQTETLAAELLDRQRQMVKEQVDRAIDYIDYMHSQTETRLRNQIKDRVYEACDIAMNIYRECQGQCPRYGVEKLVKEALRPIRFNQGRGYYFATRLDGVEMLFADRPEMEGRDMLAVQDLEGRYVVSDMIDIVNDRGEGFYRYLWTKPEQQGRGFPKIAFVKLFEPFNWLIGTGEYLDDTTAVIQAEVVNRLESIHFGNDGYLFAGTYDGISKLGPAKGKNMLELTDANGVKIVKEIIAAARAGGGFVQYVMPPLEGIPSKPKISYVRAIPEWQWYVGAGTYLDEIQELIESGDINLKRQMSRKGLEMLFIFLGAGFLAMAVSWFVYLRIRKERDVFSRFFRQAAESYEIIDESQLYFSEFQSLARSANEMLAARESSEERYRSLYSSMKEGVALHEVNYNDANQATDYTILDVNPAFESITGIKKESAVGRKASNLYGTDQAPYLEAYAHVATTGIPTYFEAYFAPMDRHFGISAFSIGRGRFATVFEDITERKQIEKEKEKLQAQLRQAQKMEAIGTFAGGIAHDFNNILAAIVGYTELARTKIAEDSPVREDLNEVFSGALRARDLVKQILTFSRQAEQKLQPVQVNLLIRETLKFLRASLPANIELRSKITSKARVMADPTQIHQVLMNLCANALHAMRASGGVLEISLAEVLLDRQFVSAHAEASEGPHLKLTVVDSGDGMSAEVRGKIFDPFFSTKGKEEGTGLGLAVVHGVVKSCGGFITVYSEPGQGASFNVFLPIIETREEPEFKTNGLLPGGTERILFVDDEESIADIGKQMLEQCGYRVTTRTSSVEALALFKAKPDSFDLVITDMTMPNMTGDQLAKELTAVKDLLPIIICTGFSEKINAQRARSMGIKGFLMKPVIKSEMAQMVRKVLDEAKSHTNLHGV